MQVLRQGFQRHPTSRRKCHEGSKLDATAAVRLLRERIKPVMPAPADQVRDLLADLDNESFERRQATVKRLKDLGPSAAPALRQALEANPTAEKKRRLQEVLAALETTGPLPAEALRDLRAVIVLERIGSPEAREALAALAKGTCRRPADARNENGAGTASQASGRAVSNDFRSLDSAWIKAPATAGPLNPCFC
jgi:hypothetical protein